MPKKEEKISNESGKFMDSQSELKLTRKSSTTSENNYFNSKVTCAACEKRQFELNFPPLKPSSRHLLPPPVSNSATNRPKAKLIVCLLHFRFLTGIHIMDESSAFEACLKLHSRGVQTVVITSLDFGDRDSISVFCTTVTSNSHENTRLENSEGLNELGLSNNDSDRCECPRLD